MSDKQVVIELEELSHDNLKYKVTRLVNTVDYTIGQILMRQEVKDLITHKPQIKTVVKPNRKQKR